MAKRLAVVGDHVSPGLLDLKRIHQFVILAETLNFRRAAERLNMAQPPLSVSIRKLEEELGTRLFMRGAGGVSLTLSGQAILKEARQLLFHGSQLRETAKGVRDGTGGALQVGFVGSTTYGLLQKLLPLFCAEYPGVELVLREATSVGILQQLEDKALDVGLVRVPLVQASRATLVPLDLAWSSKPPRFRRCWPWLKAGWVWRWCRR